MRHADIKRVRLRSLVHLAPAIDRLTLPEFTVMLEHEVRPVTAVSWPDLTTTLISVKPRRVDPPGPDTVSQGGGTLYRMAP